MLDRKGRGRSRRSPLDQEENFRVEVEKLQNSRNEGRIKDQDIQVLLKEKFCVDHALPSVYHVLEQARARSLAFLKAS